MANKERLKTISIAVTFTVLGALGSAAVLHKTDAKAQEQAANDFPHIYPCYWDRPNSCIATPRNY